MQPAPRCNQRNPEDQPNAKTNPSVKTIIVKDLNPNNHVPMHNKYWMLGTAHK